MRTTHWKNPCSSMPKPDADHSDTVPAASSARSRGVLASMLPAREPHAKAPALPPSAAAVVVEVPRQRSRDGELQQAAQVAVERMAARRNWPQVEIFVPAEAGGPAGARDA